MRLFLIRHGAVSVAKPGSFYGGTEVALSAQGRLEAQKAAFQVEPNTLAAVYASPLGRAQYGAQCVVASRPGMQVRTLDGLNEISRGRWIGLTANEVDVQFPGDLQFHRQDPWDWRAHGGESLGDLRDRVLMARDTILREQDSDAEVALISHMFPTRAILADAMGLDLPAWNELRIDTGSVSLVEYGRNGDAKVIFAGRIS